MQLLRALFALFCFAAASLSLADDAASPEAICARARPGASTAMQFTGAEAVLKEGVDYRAIFCTGAGAIYVDLFESLTPETVNNFVFLAGEGYYDSTTFHRVIPNFMAQGGDPTASGRGGPGYQFDDEPVGFLTFERPGLLAMANAGPGTNGSQFFITTAPTPHLNYKHTIFGEVLDGQEHVIAIRERDPASAAEPGESLHAALIITDPATVDAGEISPPPAATPGEISAAFDAFTGSLPPTLPLDEARSGQLSTEELADSVSADLREAFTQFASERNHEYRQRMQIVNGGCDEGVFFSSLGYWLDVYADADSARAALEDEFLQRWLDSYDYARDAEDVHSYHSHAPTCAGEDGIHLLLISRRGRYLATLDVLVDLSLLDQAPGAAILDNLAVQIEGALATIFRGEIR